MEQPTNRSQMDKLVRLNDVKALFHRGDERTFPFSFPGLVTERDVESIPAVDAVEVRHSHWEDVEVEDVGELTPLYVQSIASMRCASCNRYHNEVYHYGNPTEMACYCPYCGARMDG